MSNFIKLQEDSLGITFVNPDHISHAFVFGDEDSWLADIKLTTGERLYIFLTDEDVRQAAEDRLEYILQHGMF